MHQYLHGLTNKATFIESYLSPKTGETTHGDVPLVIISRGICQVVKIVFVAGAQLIIFFCFRFSVVLFD